MVVNDETDPVPGAAHAGKLLVVVGEHVLVPMLDNAHQEVALVGEEAIDAAVHHAGALGDVGNQGVVVALLGEDRARGSHDVENAPFRRQPAHATKRSGLRHGILPRLLLCLVCLDFHRSSIIVVA